MAKSLSSTGLNHEIKALDKELEIEWRGSSPIFFSTWDVSRSAVKPSETDLELLVNVTLLSNEDINSNAYCLILLYAASIKLRDVGLLFRFCPFFSYRGPVRPLLHLCLERKSNNL